MELSDKENIIYWAKRLYERQMSPSTSGNISIKTNQGILITASGTCACDLEKDDIVLIDYNGNLVEGNKKPSSEKIMHCEIYTKRDDIGAIIHCHCPVICAYCVAGVPMKAPILPDFAVLYDEIPIVPYYCPSTIELAQVIGEYFEDGYSAVLLKNHGIVLGANDLKSAFYQLDLIRAYAETCFGAEILGGAKPISKKEVQELRMLYRKK